MHTLCVFVPAVLPGFRTVEAPREFSGHDIYAIQKDGGESVPLWFFHLMKSKFMKRGSARTRTGQSLSTAMTPDLSGEVIRIDRASLDLYAIIISRELVTFSDKIILLDVRDRFSM